jgi:hypothetical protein
MIIKSSFSPLWWLKNPHLQTLYSYVLKPEDPSIFFTKERLELHDGDFIDLFWSKTNLPDTAPLVILLHGLAGGIHSPYVKGMFSSINQAGMRSVLMHFRGAGNEPNRLIRTYHAGETSDFEYIVKVLNNREPSSKKFAIGISMGGNVLLKWLGECGHQNYLDKAIAISVPFKLNIAADTVKSGFSQIYQNFLLNSLRMMHLNKLDKMNYPFSRESILRIKDFWEYDNMITAPVFGFKNAADYYEHCSSIYYLSAIKTSTLIIHAKDDPLMTPDVIPNDKNLSQDIILELSDHGGHVGFIGADCAGKMTYWLEKRILDFLIA